MPLTPSIPGNLTATPESTTEILLEWSASSEGSSSQPDLSRRIVLVRIASEVQTPNVDDSWGSSATLRIYASTPFYASNGEFVQAGRVGTTDWCQTVDCTIVDNVLTIGAFDIHTTTDSSVPNATYTAVLFDSAGRQRTTKLANFFVDPNGLQVVPQSTIMDYTLDEGRIIAVLTITLRVNRIASRLLRSSGVVRHGY